MGRNGKGQFGNNDIAQCFPRHIHTCPETGGTENNTITAFFKFFDHCTSAESISVPEELPGGMTEISIQEFRTFPQHGIVCKENKGASGGKFDKFLYGR